jgi:hypothetical protein
MPVRSAVRAPAHAALALAALFALAGCPAAPDGTPDAGDTTPDAGDTTPDAGPPPPETTITSGPEGTTTAGDAAFEFTSDIEGATFECVIDDGVFDACRRGIVRGEDRQEPFAGPQGRGRRQLGEPLVASAKAVEEAADHPALRAISREGPHLRRALVGGGGEDVIARRDPRLRPGVGRASVSKWDETPEMGLS